MDDLAWGSGSDKGLAVEVWDSENNRLCCPECGFDLLMVDEVDNTTEEEVRDGVGWNGMGLGFATEGEEKRG